MAKLTTKPLGAAGFDTATDLDVSDLEDYDHLSLSSTLAKFYDDGKNFVSFSGHGFRYTTSGGTLTDVLAGTITKLVVEIHGVQTVSVTGLKLSAADIFDAYEAGNPGAAIRALLGGNDTIVGTKNADFLTGYTGKDTLIGGAGNDRLYGDDGYYFDRDKGGRDVLKGGAGNDILAGVIGNDVLKGDSGKDVLIGGEGNDTLYGGTGADTFQFDKSTTLATMGIDTIVDFSHAQRDRISLSYLDAKTDNVITDDSFTFIGETDFTKVSGQLRTYHNGAYTYVQGDVNADGLADFTIKLKGNLHLVSGDFLL